MQLEARNKLGATSLMVAAMRGMKPAWNGRSEAWLAGNVEIVQMLIQGGASVDARGVDNWGALGLAVVGRSVPL